MMDRKTILIVVACMLVLVGAQQVINRIYPPVPKKPKPVPALVATNAATEAAATNVVTAIESAPTPAPTPEPEQVPEQIVTLSNKFVRVEFSNRGGIIKTVELLQHKANGHGNAVLRGPALSSDGVPGAGISNSFTLDQKDAKTIVMRAAGVTKTVTLGDGYLLDGNIEIAKADSITNVFIMVGTASPSTPKETPNYLVVDWQGGPKWADRNLSRVAKRAKAGENHERVQAHWVAVKSQFFVQIVSSPTNAIGVTYVPVSVPPWPDQPLSSDTNGVAATMELPVTRAADGSASCAFTYYAGPKDYDRLVALGENQEEVMDFGSWTDFYSGVFGVALLKSMMFFYRLIPNFGVAIILVTIAIKIIFWPIQAKSIKSMKEMQKFQPVVAKLKEKYKDDPQRLNQETMKLYKEHHINPFSGCLPMFVQLPVLIAFYKVLLNDIALRGASFLWIKDLSQPDTVLTVAGFPINPLPLVMVGTQIWQQKITPTSGDPQQAKMMMFMPLIMLFFFYKAASGLVLYWTLQQLLSIAQQWWSLYHEKKAGPSTGSLVAGKVK